jgi:ABC-type bacteriocin/lantibiotic exporter with double-glycine peptidase domain
MNYSIGYVPQTDPSQCWAASTAMLANYRDGTSYDDNQVAQMSGFAAQGVTQPELAQVANLWRFSQVYPTCMDAAGWEQTLRDNGPLLVQVPGDTHHSIVVAGADGSANTIYVADPWDGIGDEDYAGFEQKYEIAGTDWMNNIYRS